MSTAAERLAQKAARLKQHQEQQAEPAAVSRSTSALPPRVKPVRSTIDLAPNHHAQLKSWCGEAAVEIGRSRVTTQDVVRALILRLLTDETLARKIRSDLAQSS